MKTFRIASSLSLALLLTAHAGGKAKHPGLVPPAESTLDSRKEDIHNCISQAKADVSFGRPPLDERAREPLQGHRTEAFVREWLPVVDRNFVPVASKSLLIGLGPYGPANLSDRYVLCLLGRGYKWEETGKVPEPK